MVRDAWLRVSHSMEPAIVKDHGVARRVMRLWQQLENVAYGGKVNRGKFSKKRKQYGQNSQSKTRFEAGLEQLFDICLCHCPTRSCTDYGCSSDCKAKCHVTCTCPRERKIPVMELEFIRDQRTKTGDRGKFQIGGKDRATSAKLEKRLERQTKDKSNKEESAKACVEKKQAEQSRVEEWSSESEVDVSKTSDRSYIPFQVTSTSVSSSPEGKDENQNREHFPLTVRAAMRHGVSQRALANILSSYAVDMGLVSKNDTKLLVDHHKVGREQDREMERAQREADEWIRRSGIDGIQFDGKEEMSKARLTSEDGTEMIKEVREDHITVTDSHGEFLTHFTRDKVDGMKAAQVIANRIFEFLQQYAIDHTLCMVGCDSTNLNTGCNNGVIVNLERLLGRRLVWSICLLHTNELPLRHLIESIDGPTASGNTFCGPIGKLLPSTQSLRYNSYFSSLATGEPLPELPPEVIQDLSWDQQYGYKMMKALEVGSIPEALQRMVIGPVSHARWLTTANRYTLAKLSYKISGIHF